MDLAGTNESEHQQNPSNAEDIVGQNNGEPGNDVHQVPHHVVFRPPRFGRPPPFPPEQSGEG